MSGSRVLAVNIKKNALNSNSTLSAETRAEIVAFKSRVRVDGNA